MNTAELNRLIANIIRTGKVSEAQAGLVRAQLSPELQTDWLPYLVPFAGGVSVHRLPSVGESCMVLAPSGDLEAAVVLCGIASTDHPSPSQSADETVLAFPDGARMTYDHAASRLHIETGGSMVIDCPNVTVNGMLTVTQGMNVSGGGGSTAVFTGNIEHQGVLTNSGSLTSNGISLSEHTHTGDSGGNTGKPNG